MKKYFLLGAALFSITGFSSVALAETDAERVERLERDVMMMQRQIARGAAASNSGGGDVTGMEGGNVDIRISTLEEELRSLRGKLEESQFQNQQLREELNKFKADAEFRFGDLEKTAAAPPPPTATEEKKPLKSADVAKEKPTAKPLKSDHSIQVETRPAEGVKPLVTARAEHSESSAGDGVLRAPNEEPKSNDNVSTPRDHYNYAFRLLNQNQYDDAAREFASFAKKYPKDPLVGNAYYWQGESYYIRKDFVTAANSFRQGFESTPNGPKAADNLLKLGMSLSALKKDEEACVVLHKVAASYKTSAASVAQKATSEAKRIGCE